jgi:hypothetical protein
MNEPHDRSSEPGVLPGTPAGPPAAGPGIHPGTPEEARDQGKDSPGEGARPAQDVPVGTRTSGEPSGR